MKPPSTKVLLIIFITVLLLSVVLATVSLFPRNSGSNQSYSLVNDTFQLSPNETYMEGLGSIRSGENVSLSVQCPTAFEKSFSILFPTRPYFFIINSSVDYSVLTQSNITYSFIVSAANYYEAVFVSDSPNVGTVHFQVSAKEPNNSFPYSWLNEPSKIVFLLSLALTIVVMLK